MKFLYKRLHKQGPFERANLFTCVFGKQDVSFKMFLARSN